MHVRHIARTAVAAVAVVCAATLAFADDPFPRAKPEDVGMSSERLALIRRSVEAEIAAGQMPGAVLAIARRGKLVYFEAFGQRDKAAGTPMTTDSIFRIASMTKPMVAVGTLQLLEQGRLVIDDPLAKYFPKFADMQVAVMDAKKETIVDKVPAARKITIQDLLRHTSGLTYGFYGETAVRKLYWNSGLFYGDFDNAAFVERIAKLPLAEQPGTRWDYGHSTDVLGRVIEVVSGQTLYEFLKQRIFTPLGMTSTKFVLTTPAEFSRMARPLPSDPILLDGERERLDHPEWESGGGGLLTSIKDYARFAQMLLNGGELDGRRYLSPASFKNMPTDHIGPGSRVGRDYFYFPGDGFGYGFGLAVRTDPGNAKPPPPGSIGELKWDSGSGTYFGVDPKLNMIYIMMEQTQNERSRITPAFRKLVYEAFSPN